MSSSPQSAVVHYVPSQGVSRPAIIMAGPFADGSAHLMVFMEPPEGEVNDTQVVKVEAFHDNDATTPYATFSGVAVTIDNVQVDEDTKAPGTYHSELA